MVETFKNNELGIEALVMPHDDKFKVILRDADAGETLAVILGTLKQVTTKAENFVACKLFF